MTVARAHTQSAAQAETGKTPDDDTARNAPVIVLTYGNAGGRRLQSLLESQPELTCTTSTGVLAACERAAAAWRQVERRPAGVLSPLAVKSIRAMAVQMMLIITVRSGRPRWCELAAAEPGAAEAFLQAFPGTRFLCLHRACPDVISAALLTSPWGLSGAGFAPYVATYPGSAVAALTAWWAAHARPVLDFEHDHPDACMRLNYEDLAEDPDTVLSGIRAFLGLGGPDVLPSAPAVVPVQASAGVTSHGAGADLPLDQVPPPLLAQVNQLHAELGYPQLGAN
jgi:sulfotransferase family protein